MADDYFVRITPTGTPHKKEAVPDYCPIRWLRCCVTFSVMLWF